MKRPALEVLEILRRYEPVYRYDNVVRLNRNSKGSAS